MPKAIAIGAAAGFLFMVGLYVLQIHSETVRIRIVLERAWPSHEQIETVESAYQRGFREGQQSK